MGWFVMNRIKVFKNYKSTLWLRFVYVLPSCLLNRFIKVIVFIHECYKCLNKCTLFI